MTDGFAALATLAQEAGEGGPQSGRRAGARRYGGGAGGDVKTALARRALDDFYARYRDESPAVDKCLAVVSQHLVPIKAEAHSVRQVVGC